MPFKEEARKAADELRAEEKLETLDYEIKLPNENHEDINLKCDLWGYNKTPCVELEVPAYRDDKHHIYQSRMYVKMTLAEFDIVAAHVEKFRKLMGTANV